MFFFFFLLEYVYTFRKTKFCSRIYISICVYVLLGDHFPLEARHHLAPWLEQHFSTELDLTIPQVENSSVHIQYKTGTTKFTQICIWQRFFGSYSGVYNKSIQSKINSNCLPCCSCDGSCEGKRKGKREWRGWLKKCSDFFAISAWIICKKKLKYSSSNYMKNIEN